MHIKKLEIAGFKSFVDRTVVHFDHDIVGIVGPNGCGKSNIVDAIRWCMGEQSAKHLRGRQMQDVIFAGSATRGPHGLAEVTLTFDNSDPKLAQELPLEYRDYAEIAVTRRLYRDGTSEYLVNKTQVRLKDLTDLFLGTGVGLEGLLHHRAGQGRAHRVGPPRRSPHAHRRGRRHHEVQARRKQAEQKMDATRQNLLRVGDIVSEIERSLASLKRQASKAERYLSYKSELEDLTLHEASHKLLELMVVHQVEASEREIAAELSQRFSVELGAKDATIEATRQRALAAEDAAEKAQTASYHADNEVRLHEAEMDRAREKYRTLEERRATSHKERRELSLRLEELAAEREGLEDSLRNAEEEEARGVEAANLEQERLDELRANQQEADNKVNEYRRSSADAQARVAGAEATLRGFEQRAADMTHRAEALEDEDGRLSMELEDATARSDGLAEHIEDLADRRQRTAEEREALSAELKSVREETVGLDRQVDQKRNELSQKRGRLRALEEIHARLEGVGQGPRAIVATKDPTVVGLLGDRFEVPHELTHALAAALGERLQWIVVDDTRRGAELLRALAASKKGRATLIARRPPYVAAAAQPIPVLPEHEGAVLGRLAELATFDPGDAILAERVLGEYLVVRDTAVAFAARDAGYYGPIVALDGTVLGRDGAITGGAGDAVAEGLLEQKREMRVLHDAVAEKDAEVARLLATQEATRARIHDLGVRLERARADAHQSEIAHLGAEKDKKRSEDQLATVQKRLVVVRSERAQLAERLSAAAAERDKALAVLTENRTRKSELDEAAIEAEARAETWRSEVQRQQAVVTERKILLAQVKERARSVGQTVERLERSCAEMSTRVKKLDQDELECAIGAGQAAGRLFVSRDLAVAAESVAKVCRQTLAEARITLDQERHELGLAEVDVRQLRKDTADATEKLRVHETALAKLEIERRHLLDGVRERFRGLELATVVGDYHKRPMVDGKHRARMQELTDLLDRMGPVNLDAVREHAEAQERFTYYSSQKADLDKALADLEEAIAQMNRESKKLFRDAFEGINQRFKMIFPRMFRGGQAELRLTNPDDMLETGIEILAQPPGKKLASIELMSGGEKALTAVSLIFAIFQFKPSPFCILDEVDAPLDEANVARYNEGIRSMTDRSQFILITHIKRTMQSVDVLYGVTMQEPGVSKLVSVKINEAASSRSQAPTAPAAAVA
ncbi:MAG: chromosome segregation protein SMC [Polyangiaceae bacterium]